MNSAFTVTTLLATLVHQPPSSPAETLPAPRVTPAATDIGYAKAVPVNMNVGHVKVGKPDDCCDFLCEIYLLNCTGCEIKSWVRATLLCSPSRVGLEGVCIGPNVGAFYPSAHPWHIWFDTIRIGVWDGETCETIEVPFKSCCRKRRFVVAYDQQGQIHIVEKRAVCIVIRGLDDWRRDGGGPRESLTGAAPPGLTIIPTGDGLYRRTGGDAKEKRATGQPGRVTHSRHRPGL